MLRCSLLLGIAPIAALGGAASTLAQTDQSIETVVVTGSRLPQQNLYSQRPLTALSPLEIKLEGTTDVTTLLNNLPEAFADQSPTVSNGARGIAAVDLRGLGAKRTLVAIDGSRLMPGDPFDPVPDVDDIPVALVDHIEVLTGGASTVYGSDAMAGVVNFIMRKDFEGVEIDGTFSIEQADNDNSVQRARIAAAGYPQAPENVWDGEVEDGTLFVGSNTDNGRGNVTAYLGYHSEQPVLDRDFTACTLISKHVRFDPNDPLHTGIVCGGSGNYNQWLSLDDYVRGQSYDFFETGNGKPGSGRFEPFTNTPQQKFNYGPDNYIRRPDTRYTGGFFAHYAFGKQFETYSNFMFSDDHTLAQIAPSGLFEGTGEIGGFVEVNCSNPLMTPQERPLLCGADGSGSSNLIPGESLLLIGRRAIETGPRFDDLRHLAYRLQVGIKGDLGSGWSYDMYGQYGLTLYSENYGNELSVSRVQNALQVDPTTGECYSAEPNALGIIVDPTCVPLDIFNGIGSITPAMAKYIRATGFQEGTTEEQILSGWLTGDFGQWGGRSPLAKSPIQASFGTEWRSESLGVKTDNEYATNDLYGVGGATLGIPFAGFDTTEAFGELNAPVIEERPFVQNLAINGGYRYASYSTAGPVTSYRYGVEWQPVADLRFRGLYERAVRAPNVVELFTPVVPGTFIATDPCSVSTTGECAGVPNAGTKLLNCPGGTDNMTCNDQTGGNVLLRPEKGRTRTVGIVLTPQFLDGFAATVDYFDIRVDGFVSTIDPLITLAECYGPNATQSSEAFYCPLVHRNAAGQLFGGGYVSNENTNTGFLSTTGVDVQLDYSLNFDDWNIRGVGSVSLDLVGTFLDTLTTEPAPGLGSYDCAGLYGAVCGGPAPRWRHRLRVTWNTPWDDIALSLAWRHIGSVSLDANENNPFFDSNCNNDQPCNEIPLGRLSSFDYLDLAVDWPLRKGVDLRAGVNNVFGKEPPVVDTISGLSPVANVNGYPGSYDSLGRTIFVSVTLKD